jgi:hypothetical protein
MHLCYACFRMACSCCVVLICIFMSAPRSFLLQGKSQSGEESDITADQIRCVMPIRNHWDVVFCQEPQDSQGPLGQYTVKVQNPVLETTCEAISDEVHLKGIAQAFCSQRDSCCGCGDKTHSCPRPSASKKEIRTVLNFDRNLAIFKNENMAPTP